MEKLPKVITHPLGFTGYALGLVFGLIAKYGPQQWPWLTPVAVALATLSIIGGLVLANNQIKSKQKPPSQGGIQQTTHGDQSPAIAETRGNVNINYGTPKKK